MEESNNKSYYAIIPANVRYDKDLPSTAKLLYGEITALCNDKGYCWASNNYFATLYSASKKSVSRWVSALEKRGYVTIELMRKEGSKEIIKRLIRINGGIDKNVPYGQKCLGGIEKNVHTPIDKNVQENNTSINNTNNNTPLTPQGVETGFEIFWAAYPKKTSKPAATKAWAKLKPNEETVRTMLAAIEAAKQTADWKKEGGKYIPYPATWLNNRRWEDCLAAGAKPADRLRRFLHENKAGRIEPQGS